MSTEIKKNAEVKKAVLKKVSIIATFAVLILFSAAQFIPFYLKVVTSLHGQNIIITETSAVYWLPMDMTFKNYIDAWAKAGISRAFLNSLIHVVSFVVLTTVIAFVFGYVLGKIKFRGRKIVFLLILSTMMMPGEVLLLPNFLLVQALKWDDTLLAVILPGLVNVFGIFLFTQFMDTVPDAVLESADIDGAGELRKIFQIALPMCVPVILTYITLTTIAAWNDYLWPNLVLVNEKVHTLQVKMVDFHPFRYDPFNEYVKAAGVVMVSIPIIVFFLFNQKHFLQSVNVSGIK